MKHPQVLPPHAHTVVELGCGNGAFGAAFKRVQPACHYFGIDADRDSVRAAARVLDCSAAERYLSVYFSSYALEQFDFIF